MKTVWLDTNPLEKKFIFCMLAILAGLVLAALGLLYVLNPVIGTVVIAITAFLLVAAILIEVAVHLQKRIDEEKDNA